MDRHHLQSWHALRNGRDTLAITLDRFRLNFPEVFAHICNTDTAAASIAVQRGWQVDASEQGARPRAELDHARQTVADTLRAISADKVPHAAAGPRAP